MQSGLKIVSHTQIMKNRKSSFTRRTRLKEEHQAEDWTEKNRNDKSWQNGEASSTEKKQVQGILHYAKLDSSSTESGWSNPKTSHLQSFKLCMIHLYK